MTTTATPADPLTNPAADLSTALWTGTTADATAGTPTAEQLAERLFGSMVTTLELLSVALGDKLGWYRSLATEGPATAAQLAERTSSNTRYAREWLEQQAIAGYLQARPSADTSSQPDTDDDFVFSLPAAAAEVFTDGSSLAYMAPFARAIGAAAAQLPRLAKAYRDGGGVDWAAFGPDMREGQADGNRPLFEQALAGALASVPDLHARLSRPGARIADIGCGGGWSTIALARAYPDAIVEGFDIDDPSVELARRNAAASGISATFHAVDGADLGRGGEFDAAFFFECVHDMARPVEVLAATRAALADGGALIVMDEATADRFTPGVRPDDNLLERLFYGFSLLVCLPDGLSHDPSVGTGTVMRPATLASYAARAGFGSMLTLPIQDFGFFRFYQLTTG